jgi:hypothetical protein
LKRALLGNPVMFEGSILRIEGKAEGAPKSNEYPSISKNF